MQPSRNGKGGSSALSAPKLCNDPVQVLIQLDLQPNVLIRLRWQLLLGLLSFLPFLMTIFTLFILQQMQVQNVLKRQPLFPVDTAHGPANLLQQGRVERYPFSAEPYQPLVAGNEVGELLFTKIGISNRNTPVKMNDRVQSEEGLSAFAAFLRLHLGTKLGFLLAGCFPPSRKQYLPAGFQQSAAFNGKELPCFLITERIAEHITAPADGTANSRQMCTQLLQPPGRTVKDKCCPHLRPFAFKSSAGIKPNGNQ